MFDQFGEMLDTASGARASYFEMLARLTPAERARKVVGLNRAVRELARAGIRESQPGASQQAVEIELAARMYGWSVARMLAPRIPAARG